jgi:hypothetical protein
MQHTHTYSHHPSLAPMLRKEGRVSVQKIWNKKAPLLAFGGKEKGRVSPSAPSLSVHVVSPAGKDRFFFSLLSGFFLIQFRMSRAQCLVRTIVSRKKFRSLVLESFPSSQHYPPGLCHVSCAALWLDRGRACAGAWVALRMNREYAQGVANEQLV